MSLQDHLWSLAADLAAASWQTTPEANWTPEQRSAYEAWARVQEEELDQTLGGRNPCKVTDAATLETNTVTVRDRDTMRQVRYPVDELLAMFRDWLGPL
jgi:hypothetical protein